MTQYCIILRTLGMGSFFYFSLINQKVGALEAVYLEQNHIF